VISSLFLIGKNSTEIQSLYEEMFWHVHYVGRGGISAFAISAIDIALWDLKGKREGKSLVEMAGGANSCCKAYCGGIDLNYTLEELLESMDGYRSAGFNGVKIKIGQPSLKSDIERIAAVRQYVGADIAFMVDANYSMSVEGAIQAAQAMREFDILWFEEPTDPDNFEGYAQIAELGGVPLAMGENLHMEAEFARAFLYSNLSFIQPDASNCGGITGWLKVAEMAKAQGIPVCSHGMQELHVSLLSSQSHSGWMEVHSFPIDQYTMRPLVVQEQMAIAPREMGTGVTFDFEKLVDAHKRHARAENKQPTHQHAGRT
jgi:L-alanine-DL-glutamate epimerase-like enolase superfamily enzyme